MKTVLNLAGVFFTCGAIAWADDNAFTSTATLAGWKTYRSKDAYFSFLYPGEWALVDESYDRTPAGTRATVPTLVLQDANGRPRLDVNLRQATCVPPPPYGKREEQAGSYSVSLYRKNGSDVCAMAEVQGLDRNAVSTLYRFRMPLHEPSQKEVFKTVIKSFATAILIAPRDGASAAAPAPGDRPVRVPAAADCDERVDAAFFARHPQLDGADIDAHIEALAKEWKHIRQDIRGCRGNESCDAKTDRVLFGRHPELENRPLAIYRERLVSDWLALKRQTDGC